MPIQVQIDIGRNIINLVTEVKFFSPLKCRNMLYLLSCVLEEVLLLLSVQT